MPSRRKAAPLTVFTIGHSTRELEAFIGLLRTHGVQQLVDVRIIPRSRKNPQFNLETFPSALKSAGIDYLHLPELGGLRHARRDSENTGWRNASFRGYADYMQQPEFQEGLERLIQIASERSTAIMCAEAVPWRCHRSLIADALTVRGIRVEHILGPGKTRIHSLIPFAKVENGRVYYPAPDEGDPAKPSG